MPALILIRHSTPDVDAAVPSTEWGLSSDGRLATRELSVALGRFRPVIVSTSPERKARETAAIVGAQGGSPVIVDEDLREHQRASAGFLATAEFVRAVERLLCSSSELVFGDETADAVFLRLKGAIDRAVEAAPGRDHVLVSHGTAISIYVGRALGVDPVALWRELMTPTALIIEDGRIETVFPRGAGSANRPPRL